MCVHLSCSLTPSLSTEKVFIAPHFLHGSRSFRFLKAGIMCLAEAKEDIKYPSPSHIHCDQGLCPFSSRCTFSIVFPLPSVCCSCRSPAHLPHTCTQLWVALAFLTPFLQALYFSWVISALLPLPACFLFVLQFWQELCVYRCRPPAAFACVN